MDPEKVLLEIPGSSVLLCYEDASEFCHRHIVAAWFHLLLDKDVPEVKIENGRIVKVARPEYIEEELENIMRESLNMRGFTSLRALYLFNKGNEYDQKADKLYQEGKTNLAHDCRQAACFLRCDADEVEENYRASKRVREQK